ncbi:SWI/SNF complex subunit SWI3D isoform X2 [Miscanthus floridulus]|uniref:SWI/SNF complex subunit SWI3D isoform X2 n=1 Tax=Miscanthus floridulus TaxID=154761 RepID=UPI0034588B64
MEPKPSSAAHGDAPAVEAPRRRGGGGKRKSAGSSSTPSKRQAKERNASFHVPPHLLHSGPLTRAARQSPHKLAGTLPESGPASLAAATGDGVSGGQAEVDAIRPETEETPASELPLVDEMFEAVRSRGAGVHVVPTFAGWFSWKEIHSVEKQTLPSFFNGKSEKRTPEVYLAIRNSIMMKFHANPQLQLESKDLAELSIGETDARQEVLEFLDHWGLINFHPFPPAGHEESKPEESQDNSNDEKASLIEQLFKFESVQSYMMPLPKKEDVGALPPLPSLFPEPVLIEDVVAAAEPSVEYHCNSCSVDCSRKRYHCRTQADFDLCCDCYNEGKFDPGMAKTDFILMDSAEVSGASGTSWTDEETLLLLEGLEIFGGKWAEIAEHVATKTKAQCMLHFLQMQIEDRFHDGEDINQNIPVSTEQATTEKVIAETSEKMEVEDKVEGRDTADEKASEKTEGNCEETKTEDASIVVNKDTQNSGGKNSGASPSTEEPKQSSDIVKENSADVDTSGEKLSNVAIDILKSAFEAAGHSPEYEGSFADAGNPVMALAAYLAGLVEDDNTTTSFRSSLKAISEVSPALQLASRHCFILEDPPNELKDTCASVSKKNTDGDQTKDEDMIQNSVDTEKKEINEKEDKSLSVEKKNNSSTSQNDHQETDIKSVSHDDCSLVEPKTNNAKESGDSTAIVDKSATDTTKGNTKQVNDSPSVEVEAPDDSSLKGKDELNKTEDAVATPATVQEQKHSQTLENGDKEGPNNIESVVVDEEKGSILTANQNDSITRLKRAAATAVSAAAVKAKFLGDQEEYQIRRLTALMIEKLFQKIEVKMSLFSEIEQVVLRTREYTEKTRKKLLMERNAIIAARMGALPSRPNQPGVAGNRLPPGYGNPSVRPPNALPRPTS